MTRQTAHVSHNMVASSRKHCCREKSNRCYHKYWVFLCSLSYPACKAHAPYCHPWPVRLYHIFPHYLI